MGFFVAHVEKLALALAVMLLGYFGYSSMAVPTYDKTPEHFTRARDNAEKAARDAKINDEDIPKAKLFAALNFVKRDVPAEPYRFDKSIRRPFDFGRDFRQQPDILEPTKPRVQSNRGVMSKLKSDPRTGNLVIRTVPFAEANLDLLVPNQPALARGGRAPRGAAAMNQTGIGSPTMIQDPFGTLPRPVDPKRENLYFIAMMTGNELLFQPNVTQEDRRRMVEQAAAAASAPGTGEDKQEKFRRRRIRVIRDPKQEAAVASAAQPDLQVQEYILDMQGVYWTEIMASFPHTQQIHEYVKKLNEPARFVGLRYAWVDVERCELRPDLDWTPWAPIPVNKQVDILRNAEGFEDELYPLALVNGLAMRIPLLETAERFDMYIEEFANPPQKPLQELYPLKIWDPFEYERREAERGRIGQFRPNPNAGRAIINPWQNKTIAFDNGHLVENAMVRFWDMTVSPGKTYRYRIRVAAFNPNYQRDDVSEAEYAANAFLYSPWSDSSEEVHIERNLNYFLPIQKTKRRGYVDVQVQAWNPSMGAWATVDLKHREGDIIGLTGNTRPIPQLVWDDKARIWTMPDAAALEKLHRDTRDNYNAKSVLLDIEGGTVFEGTNTFELPREVVVANQYGDLIRIDETTGANSEERAARENSYRTTVEAVEKMGSVQRGAGNLDPNAVTNIQSFDPTLAIDPTTGETIDPHAMESGGGHGESSMDPRSRRGASRRRPQAFNTP